MRLILFLLVLIAGSNAAQAEFYCERRVSPTRTEYAALDLWPILRARTFTRDCAFNGPVEFCFERGGALIVDGNDLCGYNINQRFECNSREWTSPNGTHFLDVDCFRRNVKARVQLNRNGTGRITCYRGGRVQRSWNLGQCYY